MKVRKRQYLYVFECETRRGFKYNGYGNSLNEMPIACTGKFRVNFSKR